MWRGVDRHISRGVWVAGCVALALGCGKKGKGGPPPLTEQEQARAVVCADAVVAVGASGIREPESSLAQTLATACPDACGAFAELAVAGVGKTLAGLGATCDPGCATATRVAPAPGATYWRRLASTCGAARYGVDGHAELLTADWFVLQRSLDYLWAIADRARGPGRARIQQALASSGTPRPSLPAQVEGGYAAPPSRLGREAGQRWLVTLGQAPGKIGVTGWPTGEVSGRVPRLVSQGWSLTPTVPVASVARDRARGGPPLVVAASADAPLSDLGAVLAALGAGASAHLGVALPRGVLGAHPVALIAHTGDVPQDGSPLLVEGDAVYVAKRKIARGMASHDWATIRTLIGHTPGASEIAVQLRAGATASHLARLLDMAHSLGRVRVTVIPSHIAVPTGVAEVSADAVHVVVRAITVTGELHASQVTPVLNKAVPGLRACYAAQLAAKPNLSGAAVARMEIAPKGTVASVNVRGVDQSVSACAARLLRGLLFPSPRDGAVALRAQISFARVRK